jgi:hypothetical protein
MQLTLIQAHSLISSLLGIALVGIWDVNCASMKRSIRNTGQCSPRCLKECEWKVNVWRTYFFVARVAAGQELLSNEQAQDANGKFFVKLRGNLLDE